MTELIPIGTILALLTNQIMKTAQAAKDVVFEKESFKILAKHLLDIEPVLKELESHHLNDSPATRQALESLENDVKKANNLVDKYKNRGRFYLLIKCRQIVNEIQDVTREIGNALAALSLANIEVLSGISDQVNKIQNEMQRAQLETAQSRVQIVDKLNQGLSDQVFDKEFANDILSEIARAVGVPVEPLEISKEIASFKKEKEEAEDRKERAEVLFLDQVIELLSRADAASDYEEVRRQYFQRLDAVEKYDPREEWIQPFRSFFCCITGNVMVDPVSLCTGTTCERAALENDWFGRGEETDPETGEILRDFSYRPNIRVRQSIQEWRELNYCIKIRSCKTKLISHVDSLVKEALDRMEELVREDSVNKDWVSIGGLTDLAVAMIGGGVVSEDVENKLLVTLKEIIDGHERNKVIFIENHGIEKIVPCLQLDSSVSMAAIELLYEVLRDRSGWNEGFCRTFSQQSDSIAFLVYLVKNPVHETATKKLAEEILMKLCEVDENVIQAAKVNYFRPLIDKVIQGSVPVRISMVRELLTMELDEEKIELLGEEGLIPPLLEMASANIESKEVSLQALVKLSTFHHNKRIFASLGGPTLILKLMFSSHMLAVVVPKCTEILANLSSSGDGIKYMVDRNGAHLELEPVITGLLSFQHNLNSLDVVRKPALRALLGICRAENGLVKSAVLSASGVSVILALLDDSNQEIRELAINLLFLFSQHEPEGVVEYLLKPRRLEALVGFLENSDKGDVQMAAAGLLANLPKSETLLTEKLIELGGLKAIVEIVRSGTIEAKENALSALFRFTDPTNLESQRITVEQGVHPLLTNLLRVDSVTASARAAALLGDLSMRSHELSVMHPKKPRCLCVWFRFTRKRLSVCAAHGGECSVGATFCLLEAEGALDGLVGLLEKKVDATAYEAIQTLSTLVREDSPQRGAHVLHENGAVGPMIEVLRWGSESLKGEALSLLEKVFTRDMVELYGSTARLPLMQLTGRSFFEDGHLQRKAAKVLLLIERYSRSSSTYSVTGLNSF